MLTISPLHAHLSLYRLALTLALAHAHLPLLARTSTPAARPPAIHSLGTNHGTSVLRVIETLSLIAQRSIKILINPRRPGDLGCVVCSADLAHKELGWRAERGIVEMCRDLVNWQALNPNGYQAAGGAEEGVEGVEGLSIDVGADGKARGKVAQGPTVLVTPEGDAQA